MSDLLTRIRVALKDTGATSSDFDLNPGTVLPQNRKLRQAGVLVGITRRDEVWQLLLTKRSSALKHHPGQIAFPGGKQDPDDADVVATALREAREEVGLPTDQVDVLGTLPTHETVTGFVVTPVVAHIKGDFVIEPELGEVEEVFSVPLAHVLDPANYSIQSRQWRGQPRAYFTVPYGPYYIWGATARMLHAWSARMT